MAVTSMQANAVEDAVRLVEADSLVPSVDVPGSDAPVRKISGSQLMLLGQTMRKNFERYRKDRRIQELRWLRNQRQYLGYYDPEIETQLGKDRSRAYPKLTRVKVITMQSRIMELMFPSDDRNWTLTARPSPDMDVKDVMKAIQDQQQQDAADNNGQPPPVTQEYVEAAVTRLAAKRAEIAMREIDDQLQELGGDQSYDYIQLNNEVIFAGILNGIGLLVGPYVREVPQATWAWDATKQQPTVKRSSKYMPQLDLLPVWDFYPDMSAKRLEDMEGWFSRHVVSKAQLRKYAKRNDFFGDVITQYLSMHNVGNYKAQEFENDLRTMGVRVNINDQDTASQKFEIIVWHGPIDVTTLEEIGIPVSEEHEADTIDVEIWMIDDTVIKTVINPWVELKAEVKTLHWFLFDKDDTSPIGFGLPNIMRDTQMSLSAVVRMMLDNASVLCGPIVEMNTNLLRGDQDLSSISAYQVYYRDDDGATAQFPAIRPITVDNNIAELEKLAQLFQAFGDMETFVGPMTGGDMSKMPGEPMRNLAGASMMMGNASLPFKQIIRGFDNMTRSVIQSLVQFNRVFNKDKALAADYDVISRGATSLIAKEVRGIQLDNLAASLKPSEEPYVDWQKMTRGRFAVRDAQDMLLDEKTAAKNISVAAQAQDLDKKLQQAGVEANTRYLLAQAFKNVAQGQTNQMKSQVEAVEAAMEMFEKGALTHGIAQLTQGQGGGATEDAPGPAGGPAVSEPAGDVGSGAGLGAAGPGGMLGGQLPN